MAPTLGILSVLDSKCFRSVAFDPFCHTRGALIFVVLRDVLRVLASPRHRQEGLINCPNQNTTSNLQTRVTVIQKIKTFSVCLSRVRVKRTKFTSVMMLIIESLESLLVLQNCSANIYFLFVIYLRNSGELKCTDLYRVIEYIHRN